MLKQAFRRYKDEWKPFLASVLGCVSSLNTFPSKFMDEVTVGFYGVYLNDGLLEAELGKLRAHVSESTPLTLEEQEAFVPKFNSLFKRRSGVYPLSDKAYIESLK